MKNCCIPQVNFSPADKQKAGLPHDLSSLIRLASYRIPCFFVLSLFLCDTEKFLFLRSEQSIIPQTARQPCLCSVKYDAMRLQLAAIHRKIPCPVSFLNIDHDPQCLSKLPGGQYHVFSVFTAKVIDPAGQGQGSFQQCYRLPDVGDAPEVPDRKSGQILPAAPHAEGSAAGCPDGQPVARQVVHPCGAQQYGTRAERLHPLLHFQLALPVHIGRL